MEKLSDFYRTGNEVGAETSQSAEFVLTAGQVRSFEFHTVDDDCEYVVFRPMFNPMAAMMMSGHVAAWVSSDPEGSNEVCRAGSGVASMLVTVGEPSYEPGEGADLETHFNVPISKRANLAKDSTYYLHIAGPATIAHRNDVTYKLRLESKGPQSEWTQNPWRG